MNTHGHNVVPIESDSVEWRSRCTHCNLIGPDDPKWWAQSQCPNQVIQQPPKAWIGKVKWGSKWKSVAVFLVEDEALLWEKRDQLRRLVPVHVPLPGPLQLGQKVRIKIEVETTILEITKEGILVEIPDMGRARYLGDGIVTLVAV